VEDALLEGEDGDVHERPDAEEHEPGPPQPARAPQADDE
jgi:hypothetical protein